MCKPEGKGSIGVLILGEAPGEQEAADGLPFRPNAPAGSVLERAIRRVGMNRDQFVLYNAVPVNPPKNWLEGAPWESAAIAWGRTYVEQVVSTFKPRVILALGGTATRATTGLSGPKLGVSNLCGFVLPSSYGIPVIPCFHPSYLRRGKMSHFGVLLRCLKLAVQVARNNGQPTTPPVNDPPSGYHMWPTERDAEYLLRDCEHGGYIAYDIETPYSTEEESAEEADGEQHIKSVQFSTQAGTGWFFPWRSPFREIATRILALPNPKLGWNIWRFDNPVLESNGVVIRGQSHDLMWAWHHLQPDLPRGLQFAAAQLGWPWPWKHLDNAAPQFYGIVDVDVLQFMVTK